MSVCNCAGVLTILDRALPCLAGRGGLAWLLTHFTREGSGLEAFSTKWAGHMRVYYFSRDTVYGTVCEGEEVNLLGLFYDVICMPWFKAVIRGICGQCNTQYLHKTLLHI